MSVAVADSRQVATRAIDQNETLRRRFVLQLNGEVIQASFQVRDLNIPKLIEFARGRVAYLRRCLGVARKAEGEQSKDGE